MHIILFSTDAKSQSNVENTILPGKSFKIRTLGKKTARALGSASRCKYLTLVYSQLESKKVPNTDELKSFRKYSVLLVPLGIEKEPQNDDELLDAIRCVLEALKVIRFPKQS